MNCPQIKQQYLGLLRAGGASSERVDNLPSCSIFAQIAMEVSGLEPFWQSCLHYDGSKQHIADCVGAMLNRSPAKNPSLLASCPLLTMLYETGLLAVSEDPRKLVLPETYTKPDCDFMLQAIESIGIETKGSECSGFTPDDIPAHIKQCLLSDEKFRINIDKLDCNSLRNYYQARLQLAYGKMPDGYTMQRCSVLNQVLDQLKQYYAAQTETADSGTDPKTAGMSDSFSPAPGKDRALLPTNNAQNSTNAPPSTREELRMRRQQAQQKAHNSSPIETQQLSTEANNHSAIANVTASKPQLITRQEPRYPMRAQSKGIKGWVKLGFTVNSKGSVEDIKVLDAQPKGVFERAAQRALMGWQYQPAMVNGETIKTAGLEETIIFNTDK
ncbi:energy transducer TonB [Neptunicella sp. SCSIO 80796]|uniref:energy transducer TonB n=1 Tax=Neptunicella plasticusilytica TaxID=3117012 RepID=UPI003A4DE704